MNSCQFEDFNSSEILSLSRYNGVFYSASGPTVALIKDCLFKGGYTEASGGAIAFECVSDLCQLTLMGNTSFIETGAGLFGCYIYSPFTVPIFEESLLVQDKELKEKIYMKPADFLVFRNKTKEKVVEELSSLNRSEILLMIQKNITIYLKSGETSSISLVLVDLNGNVLENHNDENVVITSPKTVEEVSLYTEPCLMKKGICHFREIKILAEPHTAYECLIEFKYNGTVLQKSATILVTECERGEILIEKTCLKCPEGLFSLVNGKNKNFWAGTCKQCPANAVCLGGDKILPNAGYWRANENTTIIVKCAVNNACPFQEDWRFKAPGENINFTCAKGFFGNICKNCRLGYGYYKDGCFPCREDSVQSFYLSVKIIFALVLIAWEVHSFMTVHQTSQKTIMKIMVAHTNYMTAVSAAELQLTEEFKAVFDNLNNDVSVVPADIFDFHCVLKDFVSEDNLFAANTAARVICIIFYSFMAYLIKALFDLFLAIKSKQDNPFKTIKKTFRQTITLTFLICYRIMYPRVLLTALSILKCKDIGTGGGEILDVNPNLSCWGWGHVVLILGLLLTSILFWSVFIPCLIYRKLIAKKELLKIRDQMIQGESFRGEKRNSTKVKMSFTSKTSLPIKHKSGLETKSTENSFAGMEQVLYSEASFFFITIHFKSAKFFWVFVDHVAMFLLLTISQVIYSLIDEIKRLIFLGFFAALFVLHQKHSPYLMSASMRLAYTSLVVIFLTIAFEIIGSSEGSSLYFTNIFKYFALSINVLFYLISGVLIIRVLYLEAKTDLGECMQILLTKMKSSALMTRITSKKKIF